MHSFVLSQFLYVNSVFSRPSTNSNITCFATTTYYEACEVLQTMSRILSPKVLVPEIISRYRHYINVADPLKNFCAILALALLTEFDMDCDNAIPSKDDLWQGIKPFFQNLCPIIKVALCNLVVA